MTTRVEDKRPSAFFVQFSTIHKGECFRFGPGGTPAMRVVSDTEQGPHYMFLTGDMAFRVDRVSDTTLVILVDAHIIVG